MISTAFYPQSRAVELNSGASEKSVVQALKGAGLRINRHNTLRGRKKINWSVSGIEAHDRQGVKAKTYRDISRYYNAVEHDGSMSEMSKLFLRPLRMDKAMENLLESHFKKCSFYWMGGPSWIIEADGLSIGCDPALAPAGTDYNPGKRILGPVLPFDTKDSVNYWLLTHNHVDHIDEEGIQYLLSTAIARR